MTTLCNTKNLKHWKSTLLGIIFIVASIAYIVYIEDIDKIIFFGVLGLGIVLLFLPDTLISALRNFIKKNQNKEI